MIREDFFKTFSTNALRQRDRSVLVKLFVKKARTLPNVQCCEVEIKNLQFPWQIPIISDLSSEWPQEA